MLHKPEVQAWQCSAWTVISEGCGCACQLSHDVRGALAGLGRSSEHTVCGMQDAAEALP